MSNYQYDDDDIDNMDFVPDDVVVQHRPSSSSAPQFQQFRGFDDPEMLRQAKALEKTGICVYPIYYDGARSLSEGRKVPSSLAVKNINVFHIHEACLVLELAAKVEPNKTHPRDPLNPGRVRVYSLNYHPKVNTRQRLHEALCKIIPEIQPRVNQRLLEEKEKEKQSLKEMQSQMGLNGMPFGLESGMDKMFDIPGIADTEEDAEKETKGKGKEKPKSGTVISTTASGGKKKKKNKKYTLVDV
ncbi:signal recognition particle, SRP19 subunit [Paraphysoderma sedebokerense]|nr:signal recognition particle, SRP19 subunit [Paraphysoderma sedebokerense]